MMKKREILPALHDAIRALTDMASDAAKLEITDNEQASRRLKRAIMHFKRNELDSFNKIIVGVRSEISMMPPRKRVKMNTPVTSTVKEEDF